MRFSRRLLGGQTPRQFLARHWQKRPLLVRGALAPFRDPITPEGLLALSQEDDVESRLVLSRGGRKLWEVRSGPQVRRGLARLGPSHWTLLVHGVDRHRPAVADLAEPFAFVPRWRMDDVMVSLAAPQGTVGPHVDAYDVFLVQGRGRRRWQLSASVSPDLRPGLDLRILRRFRAEAEWVLEAGDVLYVPPGVAHYGVALEECLTYSVGFRAPSHRELVVAALGRIANAVPVDDLYSDRGLRSQGDAGEIDRAALDRVRAIVRHELRALDGRQLACALGELVTSGADPAPPARRAMPRTVALRLRSGWTVARSAASRAAYVRRRDGVLLFVDGRVRPLPRRLLFAARLLCGPRRLPPGPVRDHLGDPSFVALLAGLVGEGAFVLVPPGR